MLPQDVDFRVMLTFLDFYNTLLQFVNFKLYHALGVRYPPLLDPRLEKASQGLAALMQGLASAGPSVPALEGAFLPVPHSLSLRGAGASLLLFFTMRYWKGNLQKTTPLFFQFVWAIATLLGSAPVPLPLLGFKS
jgi:hypothetical protein